jgi:hypothetical protein
LPGEKIQGQGARVQCPHKDKRALAPEVQGSELGHLLKPELSNSFILGEKEIEKVNPSDQISCKQFAVSLSSK